jgi:hypothetical protein
MPESPKVVPPVTDSPWFWVMLFSLAALAGIATIGPKFERREQAIETKFHARERGLKREAAEPATAAEGSDAAVAQEPHWEPIFSVGPIMAVVGAVALLAFVQLIRLQRRRFAELRSAEAVQPPGKAGG